MNAKQRGAKGACVASRPLTRSTIAKAIFAALVTTHAVFGVAHAQSSNTAATSVSHYHISAGSLAAVLLQYQTASGQTVQASDALLSGRQSPGAMGNMSPEAALQALLSGTGLQAQRNAAGQWQLSAANTASNASVGSLAQVTVTGTSLETDLLVYPGSVSVVSSDQLENSNSVIQAMASIPGVTTGGDSGRLTGDQFNIRGFGYQSEDRVIILQDGVRRSAALYSNHISSFRSDSDLLKRVEVVKGASSIQNGGGAIGGVVAMTNKDARDFVPTGKDAGFAAKVRYESNNYREGYLAAALAPKDQPFELLAYGKRGKAGDLDMSRNITAANGKTVHNDEDLRVAFVQGAFKPSANQRISLSHYDYKIDNETTWQTLYHTNYAATGPVIGKLKQQDTVLKYQYTAPNNPWINVSASAYHSKASYNRGYDYINQNNGQRTDLDYLNADKRQGFRLSNEAHFETGSVLHRFVTGLDYEKRKEDAVYLLNGEYTEFGSMPNTYKDFGLYGHLETSFWDNRLVTQLGGRYDRFDRRVDANEGGYKGNNFSPRIGASLRVLEGLHLLANWSEAFRAPTPHETSSEGPLNPYYWYLPNPNLKPETARETEIGFSYSKSNLFTANDKFSTKLMYFKGRIKDMIILAETRTNETSEQGSPYGTYQNIDRVKRDGIELTAAYDTRYAGISLAYSTIDQKNEATGRNTPQAFADKLSLSGYVRPLDGWKFGATVNHWFKPDQNPATTVSAGTTYWYVRDDYTIVDLYADWQPNPQGSGIFGRDLNVRIGVNNLFNASYLNARNVETSPLVGKGRNIFVNLETRF